MARGTTVRGKRMRRWITLLGFGGLGLAGCGGGTGAESSAADPAEASSDLAQVQQQLSLNLSCTLLRHGQIFTANPNQPWAQAVVVCGDRIVLVGSDAQLGLLSVLGKRLPQIDLGGRTVVPGINDAHVHVLSAPGAHLNSGDFAPGPGPTLSEVLSLVQAGAAANPAGTWLVVAVGENVLNDPGTSRFTLDPVSPNHPVLLRSWSGHGTFINTKALSVLGLSTTEPDPFGGRYGRNPGTNVLNGQVFEYAEHGLNRKLFDKLTDAQLSAIYESFAQQAIRVGYTSLQDIPLGLTRERHLRVLAKANLPLRVRSICFPLTPSEPCADQVPQGPSRARVTATGFKWITDGSPIERGAYLEEPYADKPDTRGFFNFEAQALKAMLAKGLSGSARTNQAVIHTVGDGALDNVLAAAQANGGPKAWAGRRFRIEHGDFIWPKHLSPLKSLKITVVQNPIHFGIPDMILARLGPDRFAEAQPLKTLLNQGIPLAMGTDAIGGVQTPWLDMFLAQVHPTHPSEAVSAEEAVTAYTRGSALAEFADDKGMLAPGMLADLAVLSQDAFAPPSPALIGTQSVLTMVGGEIVWRSGI